MCFGNLDVRLPVQEPCLQSIILCGSRLYKINILALKSNIFCISCSVELQKQKTSLSASMNSSLQDTASCWRWLKFSFCALF